LTPTRVAEFLAQRRADGFTLWLSTKAMVPVLVYLRELGVVPTSAPPAPATEAEQLQEHYRTYLVQERGLAPGTIASYLHVARLFLAARAGDGELHLERLSAAEVTEFVLVECAPRSVGSAKYVVCGLRSLLRYLYVAGRTEAQMEATVPMVAGWRLAGLPITFGPAEVARLLASCDRRSTFGRRDYAVEVLSNSVDRWSRMITRRPSWLLPRRPPCSSCRVVRPACRSRTLHRPGPARPGAAR